MADCAALIRPTGYSPQEAMKVVSDNERELPAVEAAVRAAIEKLTKKIEKLTKKA